MCPIRHRCGQIWAAIGVVAFVDTLARMDFLRRTLSDVMPYICQCAFTISQSNNKTMIIKRMNKMNINNAKKKTAQRKRKMPNRGKYDY